MMYAASIEEFANRKRCTVPPSPAFASHNKRNEKLFRSGLFLSQGYRSHIVRFTPSFVSSNLGNVPEDYREFDEMP